MSAFASSTEICRWACRELEGRDSPARDYKPLRLDSLTPRPATDSLLDRRIAALTKQARKLISQVDEFYETDDPRAPLLDALLEELLDELEGRLLAQEEEGGEAEDCYDGAGIEDQFVDTWRWWLNDQALRILSLTRDDLAPLLRGILREAVRGPYSPSGFLDTADDQSLLDLAADLYWERQALLSRIRSASPTRHRLRIGVGQL